MTWCYHLLQEIMVMITCCVALPSPPIVGSARRLPGTGGITFNEAAGVALLPVAKGDDGDDGDHVMMVIMVLMVMMVTMGIM